MKALQIQTHVPVTKGYWYVSDLPKHDGLKPVPGSKADWGFTDDPVKAIDLTPYWMRRFKVYSRLVNREVKFI